MLIFAITLLTVPLPAIGAEFGLDRSGLVLLSAAYGLSFSGLLLFGGRLTDRLGSRPVLATGLALFTAACVLAAAAPDLALLLAARFTQGVGAALVAPAALAAVRSAFPNPDEHARAMATWGGLSILGATVGTLVSGVVTTWVSWRWMFAVPLLVSGLALLLVHRLAASDTPLTRPALDAAGAVLATAGLSALSYGVLASGEHGWASATALGPVGVGVVLLAGFAMRESRCRDPLLPVSYLADHRRVTALAAIALTATGTTVAFLFIALYLQQLRGWSPMRTSFAFAPYVAALLLSSRAAGRLVGRYGAWVVAGSGLASVASGLAVLSKLDMHSGYVTTLLPGTVLLSVGAALTFAAATVLALAGTAREQMGLGGGVMNTAMELGPTIGLALLTTVAIARAGSRTGAGADPAVAAASGYAWAFGVAAVAFGLLAGLTALIRPTKHPTDRTRRSTMSTRFSAQTVLVTGGGTGIGRAVALAFAKEGATVAVAGRTAESLAETVKLVEHDGGRATAFTADVTDSGDVTDLVARVVAGFGGLDIAVNSAGSVGAIGPVGNIDENEWDALLRVNLTGTLLSMKQEIAHMRTAGGGVIVNIASTLGAHKRVPGLGAYITTKAAVSALTRNAALDHVHENIRINAVSPGPLDTPMSYRPGETAADRDTRIRNTLPAGRVGSLAEISAAVLYLASPEASFHIGTDLVLDGGAAA
jgi:NAD(P)-dependent dehydrogenase (short-subunit alcohol dehydrogenase family)/predicted MFS family arabinose efflux permease